jgi:hypothetical protein
MAPSQNQRVCEHVPAVLGTTEAMDERYGLQDYDCRKRRFWVVDGQTGSNRLLRACRQLSAILRNGSNAVN